MHALKLVRRRAGLARTPWVDVRVLYKTVREQPGNNPYEGQECAVTGALTGIPALRLAGDNPSANVKPRKKIWALEDMGLESFYTTVCIIAFNLMQGWRSFMCKEFMHGVNYASYICKDIRYSDLYFLKKPLKYHFTKITHWACATKNSLIICTMKYGHSIVAVGDTMLIVQIGMIYFSEHRSISSTIFSA